MHEVKTIECPIERYVLNFHITNLYRFLKDALLAINLLNDDQHADGFVSIVLHNVAFNVINYVAHGLVFERDVILNETMWLPDFESRFLYKDIHNFYYDVEQIETLLVERICMGITDIKQFDVHEVDIVKVHNYGVTVCFRGKRLGNRKK